MGDSSMRGTNTSQDVRFSDKEMKALKGTKFPKEFSEKVDVRKVNMAIMRPWVAKTVTELVGFEDDIVVEYTMGLLEDPDNPMPDPRKMQISLTGFLAEKTPEFTQKLWNLLLSAQVSLGGIPAEFLAAKKAELLAKQAEEAKMTDRMMTNSGNARRELGRAIHPSFPDERRGGPPGRDGLPRRPGRSPPPRGSDGRAYPQEWDDYDRRGGGRFDRGYGDQRNGRDRSPGYGGPDRRGGGGRYDDRNGGRDGYGREPRNDRDRPMPRRDRRESPSRSPPPRRGRSPSKTPPVRRGGRSPSPARSGASSPPRRRDRSTPPRRDARARRDSSSPPRRRRSPSASRSRSPARGSKRARRASPSRSRSRSPSVTPPPRRRRPRSPSRSASPPRLDRSLSRTPPRKQKSRRRSVSDSDSDRPRKGRN